VPPAQPEVLTIHLATWQNPENQPKHGETLKMTEQYKHFRGSRASSFGPEYEQLLLTVWAKTPFRFPFETTAQAKAMRNRLYAYFRHLRSENIRLDLVEIADSLMMQLAENDNVLVFLRHEQMWDHQKIRDLLKLETDKFGLKAADGEELRQPDLMGSRLARQVQDIRKREAGGQRIVPPFKT
jgi:hypothetical protein